MYGTYRQQYAGRKSISPDLMLYRRPESPENLPVNVGKLNGLRYRLENSN